MADGEAADRSPGVLTRCSPSRLPQRIVAEIETIAGAVGSLSGTAIARLESLDDRAGVLVDGLAAMGARWGGSRRRSAS